MKPVSVLPRVPHHEVLLDDLVTVLHLAELPQSSFASSILPRSLLSTTMIRLFALWLLWHHKQVILSRLPTSHTMKHEFTVSLVEPMVWIVKLLLLLHFGPPTASSFGHWCTAGVLPRTTSAPYRVQDDSPRRGLQPETTGREPPHSPPKSQHVQGRDHASPSSLGLSHDTCRVPATCAGRVDFSGDPQGVVPDSASQCGFFSTPITARVLSDVWTPSDADARLLSRARQQALRSCGSFAEKWLNGNDSDNDTHNKGHQRL